MNLDRHVTSAAHFIDDVAAELGIPKDRERAARILRVVLHTLRERLSAAESLDLLAQLPMFIKGMYVDGWHVRPKPNRGIRSPRDFIVRMCELDFGAAAGDFPSPEAATEAARAVFRVLQRRIGEDEAMHVARVLPEQLVDFWMAA
jgi:uncharacterized protein (DUF2267 family)